MYQSFEPRVFLSPDVQGGSHLPPLSISAEFFSRSADLLAPALLGKTITTVRDGKRVSGIITETYAYTGGEDKETHPYRGAMCRYEDWKPGSLYIYLTQGHSMLTFAAPPYSEGACVLVRGVKITEGMDVVRERGIDLGADGQLDGPGRVTKAFGITAQQNASSALLGTTLELTSGRELAASEIGVFTRPNATKSPELPLKFKII